MLCHTQDQRQGLATPTCAGQDMMANESTISLHQTIIEDLKSRIFSGELPPGTRIPSEHDLAATYDCSRMTVNKAITSLARVGLVTRRMGAGSFIALPNVAEAVIEIRDLGFEVAERGLEYRIEVLKREVRQATRSEQRLLTSGKVKILSLTCLHFAGDRACALEHRIINLNQAPTAQDVDFSKHFAASWISTHVSWLTGEHEITAVNADAESAKLLGIDQGRACMQVTRWVWREECKLTHAKITYPGDWYSIIARFRP